MSCSKLATIKPATVKLAISILTQLNRRIKRHIFVQVISTKLHVYHSAVRRWIDKGRAIVGGVYVSHSLSKLHFTKKSLLTVVCIVPVVLKHLGLSTHREVLIR